MEVRVSLYLVFVISIFSYHRTMNVVYASQVLNSRRAHPPAVLYCLYTVSDIHIVMLMLNYI